MILSKSAKDWFHDTYRVNVNNGFVISVRATDKIVGTEKSYRSVMQFAKVKHFEKCRKEILKAEASV